MLSSTNLSPNSSSPGENPGPAGFIPGKGSAYEYVPSWMEVPRPYATEKQPDPLVVIKLFTPDSNWSWFILEFDGEDLAFGLVCGFETELGDFSLSEMAAARGPLGVQPERDIWFRPIPITQLPEYRAKWGDNGPYSGGATSAPSPNPPIPPIIPPGLGAPLPEDWTGEDIEFLLTQLELSPILVADTALGVPTIHDFPQSEHLGYGLFCVIGHNYKLSFDGGNAMRRTPSGKGWTPLEIQGEYFYDIETVRASLIRFLPTPDKILDQPETLTTDEALGMQETTVSPEVNPAQTLTSELLEEMNRVDNARIIPNPIPLSFKEAEGQAYFEGDYYLLLGPKLDPAKQMPTPWVWFTRKRTDTNWQCVFDPTIGAETCIGAFSLQEALDVAQRVMGLTFTLLDTPAELEKFEQVSVSDPLNDTPLTPEAYAEYAELELALLTGIIQKKSSAFHRALQGIKHPGTLNLALKQVNGDHRRRELFLCRLKTIEKAP